MPRVPGSDGSGLVPAVEAAAQRLAARLSHREASPVAAVDVKSCPDSVPLWWRRGLAGAAIFGDGLMSLPGADALGFSRPVAMLSAAEISAVAGGEYVPLAWLDGGAAVALVHDRASRPVVAVSVDQMQGGLARPERLADSLVAFLDALMPQTVCRLIGPGSQATVELSGELSLLVEHDGVVEQRSFDSAEAVGEFVADFLDQAIEAGMRLAFCSARLHPLIHARAAWMAARSEIMPEVRARAAIQHLLADKRLELEEDISPETLEDLIDEAARWLERHGHGQRAAERFADWLSQHPAVNDLYADDDTVRAALSSAVVGTARLTEAITRAGRRGQA